MTADDHSRAAAPEHWPAVLETRGLTKRFGGLTAVDDVWLTVPQGEIRGIIGPNGAGKSTLFGLISGHVKPTAGAVEFEGRTISGLPANAVARRGIARKFQITNVFGGLTVGENLALAAVQRHSPSTLGLLRPQASGATGAEILEWVHLSARRDTQAAELSHGEQQLLELGMVIATGARLLLLDEPTAGMSLEERVEMARLIRGLAGKATIIITEHDFDFIKDVVDSVTVLNQGAKLAEGSVAMIEGDPAVRACYLGEEHA